MNRKKIIYNIFILIAALVVISCNNNNGEDPDPPVPENTYLVEYEEVNSYATLFIREAFIALEKEFPGQATFSDKVKYGVRVYRVAYKTKFQGEEITASGVVCVPIANPVDPLPLLSFQNGTITQHSKAPTLNYDDDQMRIIESVASFGFVVAIPDYLGFGSSSDMFHPYLDKKSTVQSILDFHGAVEEMVSDKYLDIYMGKDLYVAGYSQGGWASMALQHEIETKYSSKYNLKGSACGGSPFDITGLADYLLKRTEYPRPAFIGYLFNSLIKTNSVSLTYSDFFKSPYAEKIEGLFDGTKSAKEIDESLTHVIADLFTADFIQNYKTGDKYASFRTAIDNNSVKAWNMKAPLFMRHVSQDEYVPYSMSENMYNSLINDYNVDSEQIDFGAIPSMVTERHDEGAIFFGLLGIQWILNLNGN